MSAIKENVNQQWGVNLAIFGKPDSHASAFDLEVRLPAITLQIGERFDDTGHVRNQSGTFSDGLPIRPTKISGTLVEVNRFHTIHRNQALKRWVLPACSS